VGANELPERVGITSARPSDKRVLIQWPAHHCVVYTGRRPPVPTTAAYAYGERRGALNCGLGPTLSDLKPPRPH
jgi:hypothetical protein